MRKLVLPVFLTLLSFATRAQVMELDWLNIIDGRQRDVIQHSESDSLGNLYVTGYFESNSVFNGKASNTTLNADVDRDMFVAKYDEEGNLIWTKQVGGSGKTEGYGLDIDNLGNVVVCGHFTDTTDFDPGVNDFLIVPKSNVASFILKLDKNGAFVWAKHFEGKSNISNLVNFATLVSIMANGNIIVAGNFSDTVDFDSGLGVFNLAPNPDRYGNAFGAFVVKLDNFGNLIWARNYGNGGMWALYSDQMATDADANIYFVGAYQDSIDLDPSPKTKYYYSVSMGYDRSYYVLKLDSNGLFLWAHSFGDAGFSDVAEGISVSPSQNIYVNGYFSETIDFDPGTNVVNVTSKGSYDGFIQKFDSSGKFIWVKTFGTNLTNGARTNIESLALDKQERLYISGHFNDTMDIDPGPDTVNLIAKEYGQGFCASFDSSGKLIWAREMGTTATGVISVGKNEQVYLAGWFLNRVDFDPSLVHQYERADGHGSYVLKLSDCPSRSLDVISSCVSHTWIDGNTYYKNDNRALYVLKNTKGCDSVIGLDLTIYPVDIELDTTGIPEYLETVRDNHDSYQWLDCNSNYNEIIGENNFQILIEENGSYAVKVTQNDCVDTSICVNITLVGMNKVDPTGNITISPNPSNRVVNVNFGDFVVDIVAIYSIDGSLKYRDENIDSKQHQIQLDVPAGLYFVDILSEGNRHRFKLVMK